MTFPRIRLWPSLSPGVYARRPARRLPFPLGEPGVSLHQRARHALWHGLRAAGVHPGDEILVPAYHCGTEVEALARAGLVCRFYEATESLEPDEDELEALRTDATRALLLIHYFGFAQDGARWRGWCNRHDLLLVEDCAQAWLTEGPEGPVGSFGDLAVFSLAKLLPLPDGGALRATAAVRPSRPAAGPVGAAPLVKRHVRWLASRSGALDRLVGAVEPPPDESFDFGDPDAPPSKTTLFLLPRIVDARVADRRRANYARLLEEFGDLVPPPFARLPPGACPVMFPVEEEAVRVEAVRAAGVAAEPFWPRLHPLLPAERFPGALAWHSRFVALPVHEQLRPDDLERVASSLQRAMR